MVAFDNFLINERWWWWWWWSQSMQQGGQHLVAISLLHWSTIVSDLSLQSLIVQRIIVYRLVAADILALVTRSQNIDLCCVTCLQTIQTCSYFGIYTDELVCGVKLLELCITTWQWHSSTEPRELACWGLISSIVCSRASTLEVTSVNNGVGFLPWQKQFLPEQWKKPW